MVGFVKRISILKEIKMNDQQPLGMLIVTYFMIWAGIIHWAFYKDTNFNRKQFTNKIKAKARKIMESSAEAYKMVILTIEHISIFVIGFIGGACTFFFKNKYYLNTRLFTKDEVRGLVNMALGEERRKENDMMKQVIRKIK